MSDWRTLLDREIRDGWGIAENGEGWIPAPLPLPVFTNEQFSVADIASLLPSAGADCSLKLGIVARRWSACCSPNWPTFSKAGE